MKYKNFFLYLYICAISIYAVVYANVGVYAAPPQDTRQNKEKNQIKKEIKKADCLFDLRYAASLCDSVEQSIDMLQKALINLPQNQTTQLKLLQQNILTAELYNYMCEKVDLKQKRQTMLKAQYQKVKIFLLQKEQEQKGQKDIDAIDAIDDWLLLSCSDIISLATKLLPKTEVISQGTKIKKYYTLLSEKNIPLALCSLGQWYYYAPSFSGGSKKKAGIYCQKATEHLANATPYEKIFCYCFASQTCFETGQKDLCLEYLSKAQSINAKSFRVKACTALNKKGISWFSYIQTRQKAPIEF